MHILTIFLLLLDYSNEKGGLDMNYKKLLKEVAKEYNATPKEVDFEIRKAIEATGLDITPQDFISMVAEKVKSERLH